MFKNRTKIALLCATLPLGFLLAGCSGASDMGIGNAGVHDVVAGNWTAAKEDFNEDYSSHPQHPIAVFNMGTAYHHDGNIDKADSMFGEAVERGRDTRPPITLEPQGAGLTVTEHACNRLHRDNKLDANCGDQIVAVMTPPPAPIAEPAPAPEAEATVVPAPKQDRH